VGFNHKFRYIYTPQITGVIGQKRLLPTRVSRLH